MPAAVRHPPVGADATSASRFVSRRTAFGRLTAVLAGMIALIVGVSAMAVWSAWGEPAYEFASEYADGQRGTVDLGQRWYDPEHQVFYAADPAPVGEPAQLVGDPLLTQSYALNHANSYAYTDPDGRMPRRKATSASAARRIAAAPRSLRRRLAWLLATSHYEAHPSAEVPPLVGPQAGVIPDVDLVAPSAASAVTGITTTNTTATTVTATTTATTTTTTTTTPTATSDPLSSLTAAQLASPLLNGPVSVYDRSWTDIPLGWMPEIIIGGDPALNEGLPPSKWSAWSPEAAAQRILDLQSDMQKFNPPLHRAIFQRRINEIQRALDEFHEAERQRDLGASEEY